jgi:FKBP-type peptidyl-prolyl cis-trans isomerase
MNLKFLPVTVAALVAASSLPAAPALETQKEKFSYSIGVNVGTNIRQQGVDIDPNLLFQGLNDALAGELKLLTEQEVQEALAALQQELRARHEQKRVEQVEKNKAEGEAFLAENAKKPGVITLPSGLQYRIITEGSGASPTRVQDSVKAHYRGTLLDGTEFDSSLKRGEPATFALNGVIKGWTEALQLMKEGSKWELYIPSDLAYGPNGRGQHIGPNATLVFEVELIEVIPAPKPEPVVSGEIIKVPSAEELARGAQIEVITAEQLKELQKQQQQP